MNHHLALTGLTLFLLASSPPIHAASDAECAIWMCLPTGFIGGCSDAKKAFKKRVRRHKSPLPDFVGCLKNAGNEEEQAALGIKPDTFTAKDGIAAYVPTYRECTRRDRNDHCVSWNTVDAHYVKNTRCIRESGGYSSPKNCTSTYLYTEVYRSGMLFGQTEYY